MKDGITLMNDWSLIDIQDISIIWSEYFKHHFPIGIGNRCQYIAFIHQNISFNSEMQ